MNTDPSSGSSRTFCQSDLNRPTISSTHSNNVNELCIPEVIPQFFHEKERLNSFEGWPIHFLSPSSMVAAGFYYLKREDIVKCAFCGIEVGCWVEGDDPMQDHERWSPSCKFIRKLSDGAQADVPKEDGYDICGRTEFRSKCGVGLKTKNETPPSLENLGIHKNKAPSFANYATLEARLRSFDTWPIAMKLKPNTLSEAGFFYTGKGDQTVCFHCGVGLKNWEDSEDPWVAHALWFKQCNFVLRVKGKKFVDEVCSKKIASKKENKEAPRKPENKEDENNVKTENKSVCKICYTNEVGVVFLPCGHLVTCVECAFSLTTCAVCRQVITATCRVFLS